MKYFVVVIASVLLVTLSTPVAAEDDSSRDPSLHLCRICKQATDFFLSLNLDVEVVRRSLRDICENVGNYDQIYKKACHHFLREDLEKVYRHPHRVCKLLKICHEF